MSLACWTTAERTAAHFCRMVVVVRTSIKVEIICMCICKPCDLISCQISSLLEDPETVVNYSPQEFIVILMLA